ncbi:zinc-dependent metalloprotease family protein [Endozoicomonas sp.]|uniref:zinc-dependent metalloprotease family protein n=1 Tax=Endozoicomonas sp. TaxID=1892382 RepID=UPI00383B986A
MWLLILLQQANVAFRRRIKTSSGYLTRYLPILLIFGSTASGAGEKIYIDLLVYYTNEVRDEYRGGIDNKIDHLVNTTNKIHSDSGSDIRFRVAHTQLVSLPRKVSLNSGQVLNYLLEQKTGDGELNRQKYGGDMVVILTADDKTSCGLAPPVGTLKGTLRGISTVPGDITSYKHYMYTAVGLGSCEDYVMAHETGHLLGVAHSRKSDKGIYPHATGHGSWGKFITVLEYLHNWWPNFPNSNLVPRRLWLFSNPGIYKCDGEPCGVSQYDPVNGADAVSAMASTARVVADFYSSAPATPIAPRPSAPTTTEEVTKSHIYEYTGWFSEEGSARKMCPDGYFVTEIKCSGRYCDNKNLKCSKIPGMFVGDATQSSGYFSEEGTNYYKHDGKVVVGIRCKGRYCDNLSLILRDVLDTGGNGTWTKSFSEEQGYGSCGNGYVAGVRCSGRYCDNLRLYCKP